MNYFLRSILLLLYIFPNLLYTAQDQEIVLSPKLNIRMIYDAQKPTEGTIFVGEVSAPYTITDKEQSDKAYLKTPDNQYITINQADYNRLEDAFLSQVSQAISREPDNTNPKFDYLSFEFNRALGTGKFRIYLGEEVKSISRTQSKFRDFDIRIDHQANTNPNLELFMHVTYKPGTANNLEDYIYVSKKDIPSLKKATANSFGLKYYKSRPSTAGEIASTGFLGLIATLFGSYLDPHSRFR